MAQPAKPGQQAIEDGDIRYNEIDGILDYTKTLIDTKDVSDPTVRDQIAQGAARIEQLQRKKLNRDSFRYSPDDLMSDAKVRKAPSSTFATPKPQPTAVPQFTQPSGFAPEAAQAQSVPKPPELAKPFSVKQIPPSDDSVFVPNDEPIEEPIEPSPLVLTPDLDAQLSKPPPGPKLAQPAPATSPAQAEVASAAPPAPAPAQAQPAPAQTPVPAAPGKRTTAQIYNAMFDAKYHNTATPESRAAAVAELDPKDRFPTPYQWQVYSTWLAAKLDGKDPIAALQAEFDKYKPTTDPVATTQPQQPAVSKPPVAALPPPNPDAKGYSGQPLEPIANIPAPTPYPGATEDEINASKAINDVRDRNVEANKEARQYELSARGKDLTQADYDERDRQLSMSNYMKMMADTGSLLSQTDTYKHDTKPFNSFIDNTDAQIAGRMSAREKIAENFRKRKADTRTDAESEISTHTKALKMQTENQKYHEDKELRPLRYEKEQADLSKSKREQAIELSKWNVLLREAQPDSPHSQAARDIIAAKFREHAEFLNYGTDGEAKATAQAYMDIHDRIKNGKLSALELKDLKLPTSNLAGLSQQRALAAREQERIAHDANKFNKTYEQNDRHKNIDVESRAARQQIDIQADKERDEKKAVEVRKQKVQKEIEGTSKQLAKVMTKVRGIENIETYTGNLDSPEAVNRNQPGFQVWGLDKVWAVGDDANNLKLAEEAFWLDITHANFGASFTTQEMKRAAAVRGIGGTAGEKQRMRANAIAKNALRYEVQHALNKMSDTAREEYIDRYNLRGSWLLDPPPEWFKSSESGDKPTSGAAAESKMQEYIRKSKGN